mgnify:CR=1 FL=1
MEITASMVKELRERTGAGMMECKKALTENNGDIDAAAEALRKSGLAKADKKADRVAAEGRVAAAQAAGKAVLVEVNSETDFVAKDENFVAFTCDDTDYNWSFFTPEVLAEMARRWRVAKEHPLTKGLGPVGVWQEVSLKPGESTYGYLASPVRPAGAEVLIEVEHQRCPYDGVHYVRQDEVNGVFPLLTVHRVGNGTVVRHYAAVSLGEILGDAYPKLIANLVQGAERE